MADGVDFGSVEEAGVVDGAVVEGLDDDLVLVGDGGVTDVDEPVRGAREEDLGVGWVEVELFCGGRVSVSVIVQVCWLGCHLGQRSDGDGFDLPLSRRRCGLRCSACAAQSRRGRPR